MTRAGHSPNVEIGYPSVCLKGERLVFNGIRIDAGQFAYLLKVPRIACQPNPRPPCEQHSLLFLRLSAGICRYPAGLLKCLADCNQPNNPKTPALFVLAVFINRDFRSRLAWAARHYLLDIHWGKL